MSVFVIIGALIGAGFASGQEIYLFFYKYGINGIMGLAICSSLICLVIYKSLCIIIKNNTIEQLQYKDFLNIIFKRKGIIKITNIIINMFLLMTFFIMVSGFGAYFEQELNINKTIGALILAIVSFFVFMTSMNGVAKISTFVVPIMIICILIIGITNIEKIDYNTFLTEMNKLQIDRLDFSWILQSIIYCSYNMILVIPVLINLKKYIKDKKHAFFVSIICGIITFILAIIIFLLLVNINVDIQNLEMPVVYVISQNFIEYRFIYGIVILLSIFTTAISIGITFLENVVKNKSYFPQIAAIMCISSVIISRFGFSNLVQILFPLFGYLGLIQIVCIIYKSKKEYI